MCFSKIRDTMTAEQILLNGLPTPKKGEKDESVLSANSVALKWTLLRRLQLDLLKDQGDSDWGIDGLTSEQMIYSAQDVLHLHDLREAQEKEIRQAELGKVWDLERRLAPIVVGMSNTGIRFDTNGVADIVASLKAKIETCAQKARAWLGVPGINLLFVSAT